MSSCFYSPFSLPSPFSYTIPPSPSPSQRFDLIPNKNSLSKSIAKCVARNQPLKVHNTSPPLRLQRQEKRRSELSSENQDENKERRQSPIGISTTSTSSGNRQHNNGKRKNSLTLSKTQRVGRSVLLQQLVQLPNRTLIIHIARPV